MTTHSVAHADFRLERTYPASPARVYAAFADQQRKAQWFGAPEGTDSVWTMDFREGGLEEQSGPFRGQIHSYVAVYHDIVPEARIVYSYTMVVDGVKLSTSLTSLEFAAAGDGTALTMTEQGAFFDGHEDPKLRETGTGELLDFLGTILA